MTDSRPVRIALIGSGIFARQAHLPALRQLEDHFEIVAVYSRTLENAERLAREISPTVEATTDLDSLIARDDIEAVDILLPIEQLPQAVAQALDAGKHVISEKPAAPDVEQGRALLAHARARGQVWMVAENCRYIQSYRQAAEQIARGDIGRPLMSNWLIPIVMTGDNRYYHTDWRRSGTFQGGFILDAGVHHVATLRMLLGEIASVSAYVAQHRADLPPADTLTATLEFDSGAIGTYALTFAASVRGEDMLQIVGDQGSLDVSGQSVKLRKGKDTTVNSYAEDGVRLELQAFAESIRAGVPHHNTPEQAVQDVAVIEAMLRSAAERQPVRPERFV